MLTLVSTVYRGRKMHRKMLCGSSPAPARLQLNPDQIVLCLLYNFLLLFFFKFENPEYDTFESPVALFLSIALRIPTTHNFCFNGTHN